MASQILTPARFARLTLLLAFLAGGLAVLASGQSTPDSNLASNQDSNAGASSSSRQPVLVELFTSEGCSDCPPADALLEKLDAEQFVSGAQAIVLSEHVTYWNHLGWSDPFSFDAMTDRQQDYVTRFGLPSSYTPQMVVDGAVQFAGNDPAKLSDAVARAAATPKPKIEIDDAHWADGSVLFSVHGDAGSNASLIAVLAQNATSSQVARGENAGRTLHHVAVVRVIKDFGSKAADGRQLKLSGAAFSGKDKTAGPIRLAVFFADRKNGHVTAAAEQMLNQ